MKRKKYILLLITITLIAILTGCSKENNEKSYLVTFDYGYDMKVDSIFCKENEKVTPIKPEREGYRFISWKQGSNDFDFDTPITEDVNLFADWLKLKPINVYIEGVSKRIYIEPKDSYTLADFNLTINDAQLIGFYTKVGNDYVPVDLSKGLEDEEIIFADFMTSGLEINKNDTEEYMEVTNYTGTSTNIIIPSFYENKPVKVIKNLSNKTITNIDFGKNIETIGLGSFNGCNIDYLKIPKSVKIIDDVAFSKCNINKIEFEENSNLKVIGMAAFFQVSSLDKIILPKGLNKIETQAFNQCLDLKSVYIPNTVTTLENNLFNFCEDITIYRQNKLNNIHYNDGMSWDDNQSSLAGKVNIIYVSNSNGI